MSLEEKLVNRILSVGSAGIKKTDLRREFGDIDTALENTISKGDIFVDKRANAYLCFHKNHYVQSLLNSEPRFKLTYEMIKSVNESNNISNLASVVLELKNNQQSLLAQHMPEGGVPMSRLKMSMMSVQDFKVKFDVALATLGSSIGWIELAKIRNKMCDSCNISSDEFYELVSELTSKHQDRYELSTGGGEGVMVRGILHGFVRCI